MCGRFTVTQIDEIYKRFHTEPLDQPLLPSYNVAPSQMMPVVLKQSPNQLELMKWGLIPAWGRNQLIINARAETLAEKSSFKILLQLRRCLIPADGFFEWRKEDKQPFYFRLKDKSLFAFAGLYDIFADPDGKQFPAYAIVTTKPNKVVKPIHNRMPVILNPKDEEVWINPLERNTDMLLSLLKPYRSNMMEAYGVSRLVNNSRSEGPELIEPI